MAFCQWKLACRNDHGHHAWMMGTIRVHYRMASLFHDRHLVAALPKMLCKHMVAVLLAEVLKRTKLRILWCVYFCTWLPELSNACHKNTSLYTNFEMVDIWFVETPVCVSCWEIRIFPSEFDTSRAWFFSIKSYPSTLVDYFNQWLIEYDSLDCIQSWHRS